MLEKLRKSHLHRRIFFLDINFFELVHIFLFYLVTDNVTLRKYLLETAESYYSADFRKSSMLRKDDDSRHRNRICTEWQQSYLFYENENFDKNFHGSNIFFSSTTK